MNNFYSFDEFNIPFEIRALFWGIYLVVFVFAVWKTLVSATKYEQQTEVSGLFGVFFALYAVFYCINPDYFRYREWLNVVDINLWDKERFYLNLVLFCRSFPFKHPFEVFRLIVWGGGLILVYQTYRMYRRMLLPGLTLLLLFVFHASTFSYARASLAMAVYFFGIAIALRHNGTIPKLLGIGIALSSYYFHRELLIGIAVLPCLLIPFERKNFTYLSIVMLVIVIIAITFLSTNLEFLDKMFDNDDITSKIDTYNDREQGAFRLSTFINYLKYFYPFYIVTKYIRREKVPRSVTRMYRVTYGILMASVAFMVVFGLRSVYTYRILYIAMIPLTLLISYGCCQGYFTGLQFPIMMIIALIANSIRFINAQ